MEPSTKAKLKKIMLINTILLILIIVVAAINTLLKPQKTQTPDSSSSSTQSSQSEAPPIGKTSPQVHVEEPDPYYNHIETLRAEYRKKAPDALVESYLPIDNYFYEATATMAPEDSPDYFYFTVKLKIPEKDEAKKAFILWLESIGLTDKQIESLNITYQ